VPVEILRLRLKLRLARALGLIILLLLGSSRGLVSVSEFPRGPADLRRSRLSVGEFLESAREFFWLEKLKSSLEKALAREGNNVLRRDFFSFCFSFNGLRRINTS
jgi:hypothetical protein